MDMFGVPHKVNRNVYKAVKTLQSSHFGFVSLEKICNQVKKQLRPTKPVPYVDVCIALSLNNLTNAGLLVSYASSMYAVGSNITSTNDAFFHTSKARPKSKAPGAPTVAKFTKAQVRKSCRLDPSSKPKSMVSGATLGMKKPVKRIPTVKKGVTNSKNQQKNKVKVPSKKKVSLMCLYCRSALEEFTQTVRNMEKQDRMELDETPPSNISDILPMDEDTNFHFEFTKPLSLTMNTEPLNIPKTFFTNYTDVHFPEMYN